MRLSDRREGRLRFVGVGVGMAIVFALWTVPAYWELRARLLALPALVDQWALMAIIGFGVVKLGTKLFTKRRFPYRRDDLTIA